jgi:hypothetical protein
MLRRVSRVARLLPALACLLAFGCGDTGTHHVSGKVTFQGKDVPTGMIYFMPDGSKGNSGPTGFAEIKDGQYDTSSGNGRGAPPGPIIIAIEGFDPSAPPDKPKTEEEVSAEATVKVLFPRYELAFDMPTESITKDIDVPPEAAKGPQTVGGPKPGEIIP